MNKLIFLATAAALAGVLFASPTWADKQRPAKGSLCVNVNDATADELISLPEIGSDTAKEIFSKRPYGRIEDLLKVKGIGKTTLGIIRPYVKIKGKTKAYSSECAVS